jgi:alkylation response protein AidB-like acyl-CoA dehydrogenase
VTTVTARGAEFLDRLRLVIEEEIGKGAADRDRERRYGIEQMDRLGATGFWALTVPTEFGGLGLGTDVLVEVIMWLSAADASLGQVPQNHFNSVERLVLAGSSEQRWRWLPPLATGCFFGNATAEPGERPPGESATALSEVPGGWSLTGRKVYATGALFADTVSVQARSDDGAQVAVLVPQGTPGMTINDDWQSFGQRTTASGSAEFRDVRVDDLSVLPIPTDPRLAYRLSAHSQVLHAAIDTGIAEGALREATALARTVHGARGSGAARFTHDSLGLAHLGELAIATTVARRLTESAAAGLARLDDSSTLDDILAVFYEVIQAKVVSTRSALQVAGGLFDVGGASSTRPVLGLDRYWRDARTHTLHDAVRWKPHSLGTWLVNGDVADPWSLGSPLRHVSEIEAVLPGVPRRFDNDPREHGPTR